MWAVCSICNAAIFVTIPETIPSYNERRQLMTSSTVSNAHSETHLRAVGSWPQRTGWLVFFAAAVCDAAGGAAAAVVRVDGTILRGAG